MLVLLAVAAVAAVALTPAPANAVVVDQAPQFCGESKQGWEVWSAYQCDYGWAAYRRTREFQREHGAIRPNQRFVVRLPAYGSRLNCRAACPLGWLPGALP